MKVTAFSPKGITAYKNKTVVIQDVYMIHSPFSNWKKA